MTAMTAKNNDLHQDGVRVIVDQETKDEQNHTDEKPWLQVLVVFVVIGAELGKVPNLKVPVDYAKDEGEQNHAGRYKPNDIQRCE